MPIFDFKCMNCGAELSDYLISLEDLNKVEKKKGEFNLSTVGVSCKKCKNSTFTKQIPRHGKTASNWGAWNTQRK